MIFSVKQTLRAFNGDPLTSPDPDNPDETVELRLGDILQKCLLNGGTPQDSGEAKFRRYQLASKIDASLNGDGRLALSAEQITEIKALAAPMFSPVGVGVLYETLDNPLAAISGAH